MLHILLNIVLAKSPITNYRNGFVVKHNNKYLLSSRRNSGALKTVSSLSSATRYTLDRTRNYPSMMIFKNNKAVDYARGRKRVITWSRHGGNNQRIAFDQIGQTSYKLELLGNCITEKNNLFTLNSCGNDKNPNQVFEILPFSIATAIAEEGNNQFGKFLGNTAHLMMNEMVLSKSNNVYKFVKEGDNNLVRLAFEAVDGGFYRIKMLSAGEISDDAIKYLDGKSLPSSPFKRRDEESYDQIFKIHVTSESEKKGKIIGLADGKCLYVQKNGSLGKMSCESNNKDPIFTFANEIIYESSLKKAPKNSSVFLSIPDSQGFITTDITESYLTNNRDSLMAKKFKLVSSGNADGNKFYLLLQSNIGIPTGYIYIINDQIMASALKKTPLEVEVSRGRFYQFRHNGLCFEYDSNLGRVVLNKCTGSLLQLFEMFGKVTDKSTQKLNYIRKNWGSYGSYLKKVNSINSNNHQHNVIKGNEQRHLEIKRVQPHGEDSEKFITRRTNNAVNGNYLSAYNRFKQNGFSTESAGRKRVVRTRRIRRRVNPGINTFRSSYFVSGNPIEE